MNQVFASTFSVALLALVASPALRDPPRDSFPFSDYPMFSHGRPSPNMTLDHAIGVRADGTRVPLPPRVTCGNNEPLQSLVTIRRAVRSPRAGEFCDEVATRLLRDGDFDDVVAIELVTSEFDAVAYFESEGEPLRRDLRERCDVRRAR